MKTSIISIFTTLCLVCNGTIRAEESTQATTEAVQPVEESQTQTSTKTDAVKPASTEDRTGVAAVQSTDVAKKSRWQSIALAVGVVTVAVVSIILVSNSHNGG